MNKNLFNLFLILTITAIIISCNQDDDLTFDGKSKNEGSELEYIEYGTSFGMCAGYCIKKIQITNSKVFFEKKSRELDEYPIVTITELYNEEDWNTFLNTVNYDSFQQLTPIIGCPDCADGGAEWIELKKKNGETYKVTFEYENEPEEVKSYIQNLRDLLESYNEQ